MLLESLRVLDTKGKSELGFSFHWKLFKTIKLF